MAEAASTLRKSQLVNEVFSAAVAEIVKKEAIHTYVIMPLSKSAYTVFDRDVLMDGYNAEHGEAEEDKSDVTDCDAVVAHIKSEDGTADWIWFFEGPDEGVAEKPAEFTGSLKGCIKDMVQRMDKENGQENHFTVVARMYNMMDPEQLQKVVSSAQAYPAAEFLNRQGIELETSAQRFLNEHIDANWHMTDPRFGIVCFVVKDEDPDRPVDKELEYDKNAEAASNLIGGIRAKCWQVSVERGWIDGIQLVVKNKLDFQASDFDGDAKKAVVDTFGDKYSSVCKALATIFNDNETDVMEKLKLSTIKINAVFSLMGFAKAFHSGKYLDIPEDREADEIALDEMDDYEDHFYEVLWDCLSEREAKEIEAKVIRPLVSEDGWKKNDNDEDSELNEDEDRMAEVSPATVKTLATSAAKTEDDAGGVGPSKLLFGGGGDDSRNWTKLEWQSAMGIGQRTSKSIEISERMFGGTELNYLVKDGMDPYKFYETRTQWRAHPLVAIAYDMDFAAQYVNDYMEKSGIRPGQVEGGEYGTLMFTSTFTNGSRLFADDQGRVFLNLTFGDNDEYPEDIATNNATLLSWCVGTFNPQSNPKASQFYTNLRNYLQIAVKRWSDVCASIKMSGATDDSVLERFTNLMQNFPDRKSDVDLIVSKFNNCVFKAYNPMENLNTCIENLSKGNVTVV